MMTVVPSLEITLPSTQDELPCGDTIPMATQPHKRQMDLLLDPLQPWLEGKNDIDEWI